MGDVTPLNRKQRRAKSSVERKVMNSPSGGQQVMQLQEALNRMIGRFNEVLPEIADLKRQMLVFGKAVEEINNLKSTVRGLDAAVAAMGKLCEKKGYFTQEEVQLEVERLFDDQYGLRDREYIGEFQSNDVLFMTYSIFDHNGKLISEKTSPTMYVWGSMGIPGFEKNAQGSVLNDKTVYLYDLPSDYPVKFLAGQTIRVEFEIMQVKTKIKGQGTSGHEIEEVVESVAADTAAAEAAVVVESEKESEEVKGTLGDEANISDSQESPNIDLEEKGDEDNS